MAEQQDSQRTLELRIGRQAGPFRVEVGSEGGEVNALELRAGQTVRLGSGVGADLRLADRTVSHLHCELCADEQRLVVSDLGSKSNRPDIDAS